MSRMLAIAAVIAILWSVGATAQTTDDAWRAEFDRGQAAYDEGRFIDAYDIWLPLAESDICKAQFALGNLLRPSTTMSTKDMEILEASVVWSALPTGLEHDALGLDVLSVASAYWYQESALNMHSDGPYSAGEAFYHVYVSRVGQMRYDAGDTEFLAAPNATVVSARYLGLYWLSVAAERGDSFAMAILGWVLEAREPAQSLTWLLRAQKHGPQNLSWVDDHIIALKKNLPKETTESIEADNESWIPASVSLSADETCF